MPDDRGGVKIEPWPRGLPHYLGSALLLIVVLFFVKRFRQRA